MSVPPRNTSVISGISPSTDASPPPDGAPIHATPAAKLEPEQAATRVEQQLVRTNIRLEAEIDEQLRTLCLREKITRDTLLEAAHLVLPQHPEVLKEILELARERNRQRKEVGNDRRAATLGKRLQK